MRRRDAPHLAAGFALLCLLLVSFAGCLDGRRPAPYTPTGTREYRPAPNFIGNWSVVEGEFALYRIQARLERYNTTSNDYIPGQTRCVEQYAYRLDLDNRSVAVSRFRPLHPLEPGRLRVLFLMEILESEGCAQRGFFGINENGTPPANCVAEGVDLRPGDPWRCAFPVDNTSPQTGFLWLNVTFTLDRSSPGGYRIQVNEQEYGSFEWANLTLSAPHPSQPWIRVSSKIALQPVGLWPFGAIRRGG